MDRRSDTATAETRDDGETPRVTKQLFRSSLKHPKPRLEGVQVLEEVTLEAVDEFGDASNVNEPDLQLYRHDVHPWFTAPHGSRPSGSHGACGVVYRVTNRPYSARGAQAECHA
jgi:hypothetical protein